MALNLIGILLAFFLAYALVPVVIRLIARYNFFDRPDERKIHTHLKPSMGGAAIFAGFLAGYVFFTIQFFELRYLFVLPAMLTMLVVGFYDDRNALKPYRKLFWQIPASLLVIIGSDIRISSLYGLFNVYEIPYIVSVLLTCFTFVIMTNAFNLIDGIDGLAGTIAVIAGTFFSIWSWYAGYPFISMMSLSVVAATLAFLRYNWEPSRLFMGDTGALFLGFTLTTLTVFVIDRASLLPEVHTLYTKDNISLGVAVMVIPIADTLKVIVTRILQGRSPLSPDKTHLHHRLLNIGFSHSRAVLILASVNLLFIGLAWAGRSQTDMVMLPALVAVGLSLNWWLEQKVKAKRILVEQTSPTVSYDPIEQRYLRKTNGSAAKVLVATRIEDTVAAPERGKSKNVAS